MEFEIKTDISEEKAEEHLLNFDDQIVTEGILPMKCRYDPETEVVSDEAKGSKMVGIEVGALEDNIKDLIAAKSADAIKDVLKVANPDPKLVMGIEHQDLQMDVAKVHKIGQETTLTVERFEAIDYEEIVKKTTTNEDSRNVSAYFKRQVSDSSPIKEFARNSKELKITDLDKSDEISEDPGLQVPDLEDRLAFKKEKFVQSRQADIPLLLHLPRPLKFVQGGQADAPLLYQLPGPLSPASLLAQTVPDGPARITNQLMFPLYLLVYNLVLDIFDAKLMKLEEQVKISS